jgi:hypothetical protein
MNREDIIRMAREAASEDGSIDRNDGKNVVLYAAKTSRFLERFAALVAAAEREACAKVCEDIEEAYQRQESMRHPALRTDAETGSGECAAAIRARGSA